MLQAQHLRKEPELQAQTVLRIAHSAASVCADFRGLFSVLFGEACVGQCKIILYVWGLSVHDR